jgi:RNA polymerase sigma-70 factor (ECF subfamily)
VGGDVAENADWQDVRASLSGDGEAYARLVRRYQGEIATYMRHFARGRETCEELVQNTFVEAYFGLRGFRGDAPLVHWLRKIATRVGYRYWRQRERERACPALSAAEWDRLRGDAEDPPDPESAAALVHSLLGRLAPRDRLVLTLTYLEGRTVAETASLTGWTQTMVKVQAHRARKRLRKLLEDKDTDKDTDHERTG